MYYIISIDYVGPNSDQHVDANSIEIRTAPATTNSSHEPRTDGWCGTTNDWAVYAHGEYPTLQAAQAAVREIWPCVRDRDPEGDDYMPESYEAEEYGVVAVYKPGKYSPMGRDATADWAYEGIRASISADTTDAEIRDMVDEFECAANSDGYTLDSDLQAMMEERRQDLRDERDARALIDD